jgi:hypothetical protein
MAWVGVAIATVGTGLTIYGELSAASSRADAAQKNAAIKQQQADELLARQSINEGIMREQADSSSHSYVAGFAASGREGAGLGGVLKIKKDLEDNITNSRREAQFKASLLRQGAEIDSQLASDTMTAGYLSGAGTLLSGVGNDFNYVNKYNKTSPKNLAED